MSGSRSSGRSESSFAVDRVGGEEGSSSSPIPYRERPLEYSPAMMCHCGSKATRWISWSDSNPGRRYMTCMRARAGGCNFLVWVDKETTPFVKEAMLDLRDIVRSLRRQNNALRASEAESRAKLEGRMDAHKSEVAALRGILIAKDAALDEKKARVVKYEKEITLCFVVVVSSVLLVVALLCNL